jgi:hypothetical protein
MPAWILNIILSLALPALKQVLKAVLTALEVKYPGLKPLVDQIIAFLEGGGKASELHAHCNKLTGFCDV